MRIGETRDGRDFVARVNRPELCRLGNADRARLMRVEIDAGARLSLPPVRCRFSPTDPPIKSSFDPFRKKFRRATFVGLNMGRLMTDHAVERLAELSERQRVGGRAVKDEIDIAIGLEEFADAIACLRRPAVFAVRWCFL